MKILTLFVSLLAITAIAGPLHKARFTRTDHSLWECLTSKPSAETPSYLGQTSGPIGSPTNCYNGSAYSIDVPSRASLVKDGVIVGKLKWYYTADFYVVLEVPNHSGFAIDNAGKGWLLSIIRDGDNQAYLFQVDLATGICTYIDYVDIGNLFEVNGMIIMEPPHALKLQPAPAR